MLIAALGLTIASCTPAEDPSRAALRARLNEETRLSSEELDRLCDEVARGIEGKQVRVSEPGRDQPIAAADARADVFSLLTNRAGVFDEGLRREDGALYRILNAPAPSDNPEVEASQRLWIDVATLHPTRYQFSYAFAGYGDYSFDLKVD